MTDVTPGRRHHLNEMLVQAFYTAILKPGDNYVDVGANVGHHTIRMARCVAPSGRGLAVEPIPSLADQVTRLLASESITGTEIANVAVAQEPGTAEFFVRPDFLGWSSMFESHVRPDDQSEPEVITVEITTLDELVESAGFEQLACMKLDIEHSEFNALRGATKVLSNLRPALVYENSPRAAASINGYSLDEFFDFFSDLDYVLHTILLSRFDRDFVAASTTRLPIYYIATPREHPFTADPHSYLDVTAARAELGDG